MQVHKSERATWVSVEQFATQTSLSTRHVWRLIAERRIPSYRVGRRRVIPLGPALDALRGNGTSVAAPKSHATTMAQLPIPLDHQWELLRATEKVTGGALRGETDEKNHLHFSCPECDCRLHTRLACVSDDFAEREHNGSDWDVLPRAVVVIEVQCPDCQLIDHFTIPCDQHGKFRNRAPLPETDSRHEPLTPLDPWALIPVVGEEDVDPGSVTPIPALRVETDNDNLVFNCPITGTSSRENKFRLVEAVLNRTVGPYGDLVPISGFRFEWQCGPGCGCTGEFIIPVISQELTSGAVLLRDRP